MLVGERCEGQSSESRHDHEGRVKKDQSGLGEEAIF